MASITDASVGVLDGEAVGGYVPAIVDPINSNTIHLKDNTDQSHK